MGYLKYADGSGLIWSNGSKNKAIFMFTGRIADPVSPLMTEILPAKMKMAKNKRVLCQFFLS